MTDKLPLHMAIWINPLATYVKKLGFDPKPIIDECGMSLEQLAQEDVRITFDCVAACFERAAEIAQDDFLGFHFGQTLEAKDAGMIGYIGLSSPSLADALHNLALNRRLYSDAVNVNVDKLSTTGELFWDFDVPLALQKRQFHEFSVTNLVNTFRQLTRSELRLLKVAFPHQRKGRIREFERFFGCDVEFGASRCSMKFRLPDLDLSVRTADSRLYEILQQHSQSVLASREKEEQSVLQQVERLIMDRLTAQTAKLDVIASELGMSERTLTRRLKEQGKTFNAILDELRCELARTYLKDSAISLSEIAYLLGYSEVSAFNHAFKRWTGTTPSEVRKTAT